jgi:hypothetical protein
MGDFPLVCFMESPLMGCSAAIPKKNQVEYALKNSLLGLCHMASFRETIRLI